MTSSVSSARPRPLSRLQQLFLGDLELQHGVELGVVLGQHVVQRLGLLDRAGVAVEDEAVGGVGLVDPVLDQGVGQTAGHQVACVEVALGLQAQRACPR